MKVEPKPDKQVAILTEGQVAFIGALDHVIHEATERGVAMPEIIAGLELARQARVTLSIQALARLRSMAAKSGVRPATADETLRLKRGGNGKPG